MKEEGSKIKSSPKNLIELLLEERNKAYLNKEAAYTTNE